MKSKCSFILKSGLSLLLALLMLFGTVATSVAAVVEDVTDTGAETDLAETGDDIPYIRYMKNMPSNYYDGNTSAQMSQSTNNSNKWYAKVTLDANSSYGFFIRMNNSDIACWKTGNTTVSSGQEVALVSYGGQHGNSSNRLTYSTGSATSYVFTYDTSSHKISVCPLADSTVKMAWSIASGHDWDYNLGTYSTMTHSSNGVYYFDTTSNLSTAKYYMFIQTNNDRYHRGTSTLTENSSAITVYDYGTYNYGDSADKINFTPSAAKKYRFTYDIKDKTVKMLRIYDITYNKGSVPTNGGSVTGTVPTAQTRVYNGGSITLAANAFSTTGYTQDGWTTSDLGTSKTNNSGASYSANADKNFYPYWKEDTSVVTFKQKLGSAAATTLATKDSGIATAATYTADTLTGYQFTGWTSDKTLTGTTNVYAATATLNDPSVTAISVNAKTAITLTANYTPKTSALSFNDGGATSAGTLPANGTVTATYGAAMPTLTGYVAPQKDGFRLDGWYTTRDNGGVTENLTKYYNADGTSATSWAEDTTSGVTLTAVWLEAKAGATVLAYTGNSASGTGGQVKVGDSGTPGDTATIPDNTFSLFRKATVLVASTASGYTFDGWETGGTYGSHVKLYINSDCSTEYVKATHGGVYTTIYAKTDGYVANEMTTLNTEIHALFNPALYTFTPEACYTDDGTIYTTANTGGTLAVTNNSDSNNPVASGASLPFGTVLTMTATAASGYAVEGIYWKVGTGDWTRVETTDTTSGGITSVSTNNTFTVNNNYQIKAKFIKIYKLSAFDSYELQNSNVVFITAPPKSITVTHGETIYTYTYSGTATKGNPNTGSDAASAGSPANPNGTLAIASGTYGAGNYIQYFAGDTITLQYSAMASSELIKGVFFNNTIEYRTTKPTAAQFVTHSDYTTAKCLYAAAAYYNTSVSPYSNIPSQTYAATVDQDDHSVTFTGTSDYKNIDIELATKRKVYLSDTTNVVVTSKNNDNYYNDNEALSETGDQFTVAAAKSSDLINEIVGSGVRFYRANADGSKGDALTAAELSAYELAVTNATSTGSSSANGTALVISGKMPGFDLYVDLNMTSAYTVKLGSRIVSDLGGSNTRLALVATVTAGSLTAPTASDVTSGSAAVNAGSSISLSVTGLTSGYMFVGWYWGNSAGTAPDYENGLISDKVSLAYTPKKSGTIWAVGTKDLFINGSKYITGKDSNWYSENNTWKNQKMSFDPSRGTQGSYYWDISDTMFTSAGSNFLYTESNSGNTSGSDTEGQYFQSTKYYWCSNDDSKHGKAFFQILDSETGYANKEVWKLVYSFKETENGATYGKIYPRDSQNGGDSEENRINGQGFIDFAESRYSGYSSPLRIYLDAATKDLDVVATPVYSNLYVSNGFDVGSTLKTSAVTVQPVYNGNVVTSGQTGFFTVQKNGDGWDPDTEGHVDHYTPQKKNATVRITKTAGGNDKIAGFMIYDIDKKTVRSEKDVTKSGSDYYIDLTLSATEQNLYIVPIVEEDGADVTITFDATQLNRAQWGDIVTAFAWYQNEAGSALGGYPGQPMLVSDDMSTWSTKFKSSKSSYSLEGITFANMIDGSHTWLGCSGVMGTVSNHASGTASGGIVNVYNHIYSGNSGEYSRTNFKAQTYDYREPIALYENRDQSPGAETTISFAMKDGNTSLLSWKHTDLLYQTPASGSGTGGAYVTADGTVPTNILESAWPPTWEYLTNAKGDQYVDINGTALGANTKPTASFYIAAKGGVIYGNSELKTVFHSGTGGNQFQQQGSPNGIDTDTRNTKDLRWTETVTYGGAAGVNMNYGVEWYIYDASGNYITTVLSAGFADQSNGMSYIADKLTEMGYPVTGKAVEICYDKPRYMYWDNENVTDGAQAYPEKYVNGLLKRINSGAVSGSSDDAFEVYRFTGQWVAASNMDTVKVNVGVGMMTDSGEVLSATNTAPYGTASASYDTSKGNTLKYSTYTSTAGDGSYVQTAVGDAAASPVKLTASALNFVGWYYYDANTGEFTKATYTDNDNFYPSYSTKDVTFYAMYRASAVYEYTYVGREGSRTYSASGNDLTAAEMSGEGQNKVVYANHSEDILSKLPVGISVFKRNISFSASGVSGWTQDNNTPYVFKLSGFTVTNPTFTLTAHYKNASGVDQTITKTAAYNAEAVNLTSLNSSVAVTSYYGTADHPFLGWYAYDGGTVGDLLSTQARYRLRLTGNQAIIAIYSGDTYGGTTYTALPNDGWQVSIDENEVNKELTTSTTGYFYNDTIIRVRNGSDVKATLPSGAKAGVLIVAKPTGAANEPNAYTPANLETLVTNISAGKTRTTASGLRVTNLEAESLTQFNRADVALRTDYATMLGATYCVYAYFYDGSSYYFSAASVVKTYE